MSSRTFKRIASLWCACLLACLFVGCGGGNSGNNSVQAPRTQVKLRISWPAPPTSRANPRYIPAYAASLFFELAPKGNPTQVYTLTVNRPSTNPSTQDVAFTQLLAAGTYELAGAARALVDAQGATVASGALEINVQPGMSPVNLTLNSTVKTLLVLGQPITTGVGQALTLQSGAFDPDNKGLLLPDGALVWSIVAGSQFGTITPGGKLTATAAGTIKVHVAESVTGVFAEANVVVSLQTSTTGLAQSGYPRPGADAGSTGLVQGSGATGQIAWSFKLGNRGVNTPVLGNNNLLFALNQSGIVFALDATTGTKKWQAALQTGGFGVAFGSLVVGDDNTLYVGFVNGITAFDAGTGLPKWTNADFNVDANMNLAGGKLYVPTQNLGMGVVDSRTGTTLTELPGLQVTLDGAIANGIIYFATIIAPGTAGAEIHAVNLATGTTVWTKALNLNRGFAPSNPVAAPDGTVYVNLDQQHLSALDGQTGAVKATQSAFGGDGTLQPAVEKDGSVLFTQQDPTTHLFATVRYSAGLATKIWSSPPVMKFPTVGVDGTVYGPGADVTNTTDNTFVYAINGTDGSVKWKVPLTLGVPAAPPAYGQVPGYAAVGPTGMVYVVSIDQEVYAIK